MNATTPPPALAPELATALAELRQRGPAVVALDFDGSLAPLVPEPEAARLLPEAPAVLRTLAAAPDLHVVLVSGRAGDSLAHCAEVPAGTRAVGSHGSQWGTIEYSDDGARHFASAPLTLTPSEEHLLADLADDARAIAARHEGVHVEYKPAAVVVHTRQASPAIAAAATAATLNGPAAHPGVHVLEGKAVVEMSVVKTTKGQALTRLVEDYQAGSCLYAGDDVTDEYAFTALQELPIPSLSIKVGAGQTHADQRVSGPAELVRALAYLAACSPARGKR